MTFPAMTIAEAHAALTSADSPFAIERRIIDGVSRRCWKHAPASARVLVEGARAFGERPFLVLGEERVSFEAFRRATAALATHLVARGVRPGDRVAIAMRNLPAYPVAFYAAASIGAIVTPLNAWWQGEELAFGLEDCGATLLFADATRLDRLGGKLGDCQVVVVDDESGSRPTLEAIIGTASQWAHLPDAPLPDVAIDPDDPATIFYTSGTSGRPKGVLASHRAMLSNITGAAFAAARGQLRRGESPAGASPPATPGVTLMAVPFFHVTGTFAVLSPALHAGHTIVMMHRWDAGEALRLTAREKVTWIVGVPTMAMQLAGHREVAEHDLSSLTSLGYGGAAASPDLIDRVASAIPTAVPGHGWGMTETSGLTTTHAGADYQLRPASCGAPIAVCEAEVRAEDGQTVLPSGATGELWVCGPNVMTGYWQQPAATAEVLQGGWLRTGDLARIDAEGFVHIVDRVKDIVIRGGENIFCIEVENCLYAHPDVIDAAVVGLPHPELGEVPAAAVVLRAGAKAAPQALHHHVAERLAGFKIPVQFLVCAEPLPRNAAGKLLKEQIRRMFPNANERNVESLA